MEIHTDEQRNTCRRSAFEYAFMPPNQIQLSTHKEMLNGRTQ